MNGEGEPEIGLSRAWWSGTLQQLRNQPVDRMVEHLALRAIQTHMTNHNAQLRAWYSQIEILLAALVDFPDNWRLLLEYPLLRLGKRLDAVLVSDRAVFVVEFKTLTSRLNNAARQQTLDYALDLQDFHAGSQNHFIIPILVAGAGTPNRVQWSFPWPGVSEVFDALPDTLGALLHDLTSRIPHRDVDIEAWEGAPYRPVPTIIEAATMLYRKHGVADITEARADTKNLTDTTRVILETIKEAEQTGKHIILFVTGIPGAGKTLCGLNAVFGADTGASFLTGNLPLVHVLREALAQDAARIGGTIGMARQKTESAIQGLTGFVKDNVDRAAPIVLSAPEPRQRLFATPPMHERVLLDERLHLQVPIRSVRSSNGAPWVDAVLRGRIGEAQQLAREGTAFFVTRSLEAMRNGLRASARGQRRAGLVCSTGARRLVADGIWPDFPHLDSKAIAHWFLNRWPDVRASDALEIPATQFACQGLELDYVGLCWGGDLVRNGNWLVRKFSGTKWQKSDGIDARDFRLNTYRVLLTRARYDTIIWVPAGDAQDKTREPELFDATANYLIRCGAMPLPEPQASIPLETNQLLYQPP